MRFLHIAALAFAGLAAACVPDRYLGEERHPAAAAGGSVTVQPGDSVNAIARRLNLPPQALIEANRLQPPYVIRPGQTLTLPAPPAPAVAALPDAAPGDAAAPTALAPLDRVESAPLAPPGGVAPAAPGAAPAGTAPAGGQARFRWPLQGRVVSEFGPKPGGLHNDGINIEAERGTPIVAAESGEVIYVGNELRNFGNLILVRHADGWVTAYAHAEEILVARGAQVQRGQTIARVGSTGNVRTPQLHFEVRRGTRPVNPRQFLSAG